MPDPFFVRARRMFGCPSAPAVLLGLLVCALATLVTVLVFQVRDLRAHGRLEPRLHRAGGFVRPDGSPDPAAIQAWMTYDYVNAAFHLPAGYLRAALPVADRRYPDVSIRQEAKALPADAAARLEDVRRAVRAWAATTTRP